MLTNIVQLIIYLFTAAIFARVILSFVSYFVRPPHPQWLIKLDNIVISITEPVLAPIRRMLPNMGGLDFSPMVVLIILFVIQSVLGRLAG